MRDSWQSLYKKLRGNHSYMHILYCRCIKAILPNCCQSRDCLSTSANLTEFPPILPTASLLRYSQTSYYSIYWQADRFLSTYSTSCIPRTFWSILCVHCTIHVHCTRYTTICHTCMSLAQSSFLCSEAVFTSCRWAECNCSAWTNRRRCQLLIIFIRE